MAEKKHLTAAVIDIGSNAMRMKIAQRRGDDIDVIENVEYPVNFGDDTFSRGVISFSEGASAAKVLQDMVALARQYEVEPENMRITATTALREAQNSPYVADRMQIACGIDIDILSDVEEKALIFCDLLRRLHNENVLGDKTFMMAYIGTASLGVAIVTGGNIIYYRNIKTGTLIIAQMLDDMRRSRADLHSVLEDYMESLLYELRAQIRKYRVDGFVVCGKEISQIAQIVLGHTARRIEKIKKSDTVQLYNSIKSLSQGEIAYRFRLR